MDDIVKKFKRSKSELFKNFNISNEYFVNVMNDYYWSVNQVEEMFFLKYWKKDSSINESIIVKNDGKPIISNNKNYTMIVGIDCVKVAFIFDNKFEMTL